MKRWLSLLVSLLVCAAALAPISAGAAIVNVGGNSNGFAPQSITINAGDSITFLNKGGSHNVVADDGSFRCARGCDGDGRGGNGNASSSNWVASITFNTPGTIGYFCEVHGMPGQGMFGTITVQGVTPPPPPPVDPVPALGSSLLWLLVGAIVLIAAALRLRRGA